MPRTANEAARLPWCGGTRPGETGLEERRYPAGDRATFPAHMQCSQVTKNSNFPGSRRKNILSAVLARHLCRVSWQIGLATRRLSLAGE
jgi:hypothetical protein